MFTVVAPPNGALTTSSVAVGTVGFGSVLSGLPSPSKSWSYGVANTVLCDILDELNLNYKGLHLTPDGEFPNHHPDPTNEKNLEDIKAPECFEIEKRLVEELEIPVMHDDQHGTAIITSAALINAVEMMGKKIEDIKILYPKFFNIKRFFKFYSKPKI